MYKLVALDIDGTLLNPAGQISPRVQQTIRQAVEAGCMVTLATGRRLKAARHFAEALQVPVPIILYSGSLIYDVYNEEVLLQRALPPEFVRTMVELLREVGLSPGILQSPLAGENIYLGPPEHDNAYLRDYATRSDRSQLVQRCDFTEMPHLADPLVVIAPGSNLTRDYLRQNLRTLPDFEFYLHSYQLAPHTGIETLFGHDFLPMGYHKGFALEWLAARYGLTLQDTLAVGDGSNDMDMLQAAGLGVAMGNADAEIKAVADLVCPPNSEDGVAWIIEKYILT